MVPLLVYALLRSIRLHQHIPFFSSCMQNLQLDVKVFRTEAEEKLFETRRIFHDIWLKDGHMA